VKKTPPDQRAQARRATLNALKRARRAAARAGVELSAWEGEFLGSVEERIKTFGRAFADPEKGAPGQTLSMLQAVKLREISVKAKGGKALAARKPMGGKRGFGARRPRSDEA
jgi:hypothetical protein